MKNTLFICIITSVFIACNNKPDDQKLQPITKVKIDTSLIWIDYRLGELPPPYFYAGIDTLVKKYNLRYERREGGCVIGNEEELLIEKYDYQNQRYFKEIEKIHGKDWKKRFDAELRVLDSINEIRIVKKQDSLNIRKH